MTSDVTADETTAHHFRARFWQSPFALTAGAITTFQFLIYFWATLQSRDLPYAELWPLTLVSVLLFTAGLWPDWNYLKLTKSGLQQHAGLARVDISWCDVKSVKQTLSGLNITYISNTASENRKVRTARLFNRYGMTSKAFREMVEHSWHKSPFNRFA